MRDLNVFDANDDLADLSLTQARMIAALDDIAALPPGPTRIAIVVDATKSVDEDLPSREITLEKARAVVRPIFEVASELQVLILYFRGADEFGNLGWFTDPEEAARTIANIEHAAGWTQHGKAFRYLMDEARKQPIHAAVIFTDAVELRGRGNPNGDEWVGLCKDAMRLRRLGCRAAFAYDGSAPPGSCPLDRAGPHAEERIRELAGDNEGTFQLYNPADPEFTNWLAKVASEAALRAKGDLGSAQALLPDLRAVPFDLAAVGEKVLAGKCRPPDGDDSSRTG
jgi:hypothetical protein